MKHQAKALAVKTLGSLSTSARRRRVILCYHSVHPRLPFASATPDRFDEHLRWLRDECDVVSLAELTALDTPSREDRPLVAITFDDGYEDNHTYALPLLARHACPATFFVTVGLIERDPASMMRLAELRQLPVDEIRPLEWNQVAELRGAGNSIGGHTWSHPNLARLGEDEARLELTRSKDVLEQRLGEPVVEFAYPFGKPRAHFSSATMQLVEDAGYTRAAAVLFRGVRPTDSPLALPRFFVTGDSVETLAEKTRGRWDWLGLWQERAPQRLARMVSPADYRF